MWKFNTQEDGGIVIMADTEREAMEKLYLTLQERNQLLFHFPKYNYAIPV